ncbi:uncharacterized protein LOC112588407 [Harpegnathos saltator]|uniref:uncharacterized protein LOC112588407 n=1 Tax=Harpegnathos saltator TaxID=610380 RepID=UPI000DBED2F6|nr:uncharacterized protein LOC112588407 [Harpegnathos saltator]
MLSFDSLIDSINRKQFNMPSQWMHIQYCSSDTRLLVFFLATCNKIENYNDRYSFNPIKEVILKEDMTLQINVLKQPVLNIPSHIQIYNNINRIELLQETLFSFDSLDICCGTNKSEIKDVEYNEAFKDINGIWRHKKCLLLSSQKCKFCAIANKSINQKYRRRKIMKSIKRIKIAVSKTEKQKKILLLRKRYYKAQKAKNRAKYISNKLRKELADNMMKVKEILIENIKNQLKETQISQHQLTAIQEIIKAAKHTNIKGHRYSED